MDEDQKMSQSNSSQKQMTSNQDFNGSATNSNGNSTTSKPQVFYVYRQGAGGFGGAGSALANNAYMQMGSTARRVNVPVNNIQHNVTPLSPMQILMLQQQQQQQQQHLQQQQTLLHQQQHSINFQAIGANNVNNSNGVIGNNLGPQTSSFTNNYQKVAVSTSPKVASISPVSSTSAKPKFESGQIFYSHHPSNSNVPASRYYQPGYAKLANPPKMNKMDFKSLQKMDKFQANVVNTRVVPFIEKYFHISVPSVPAKFESEEWKEYHRLTANDDFFGLSPSATEWSAVNSSFQDYIQAYRARESRIQSELNNLYNDELNLDCQNYVEPAYSLFPPDSFVTHSSDDEEMAALQQKKSRGKIRLSFSADAVASANLKNPEGQKKSRKRKTTESPTGKTEAPSQSKNKKARKKKSISVDPEANVLEQKKSTSSSRKSSPKELKGISLKPSVSSISEKSIEEKRQKLWSFICKKAVPKAAKAMSTTLLNKTLTAKRVATICAREQRKAATKVIKTQKDIAAKAKKFMKDVLVFWKRNEKEEREARKRAEKEALEKRRVEEEMKEAKRQARKLNFLITQTELYSHFVGKKMEPDSEPSSSKTLPVSVKAIDFDEVSDEALKEHATLIVKDVVQTNMERTRQFDHSNTNSNMAVDDESLESGKEVPQPAMLTCQLKPYQMRGFNWLVNLYNQGINGILADDMGLGKTVQSISLLAYLAETQNAWGPFLVISPASTLHNWLQEIAKFAPKLKAIPYWGTVKDRQILRRYWNPKKLRCENSPFHICVTSYQMIVSDEKYFQRMQWQYMILDEAHAIKSSSSARWKILLNFNCRNRLLLTGTPIQNSMQELWALLHFIMPGLFDSHDEFSDWFSKDIESHAEKKGDLNEHQLTRLHMILKPFMLRRVKKEVENELGEKVEKEIMIDLSAQQKRLYKGIRDKIPISELLEKSNSSSDSSIDSLMNLVMQFRKVCNHPELFERAETKSPFCFTDIVPMSSWWKESVSGSSGTLSSSVKEPRFLPVYGSALRNPISYEIPQLLYRRSMSRFVSDCSVGTKKSLEICDIYNVSSMNQSMSGDSAFSFIPFSGVSPNHVSKVAHGTILDRLSLSMNEDEKSARMINYYKTTQGALSDNRLFLMMEAFGGSKARFSEDCTVLTKRLFSGDILYDLSIDFCLRRLPSFYMEKIVSGPIDLYCCDSQFMHERRQSMYDSKIRRTLLLISDGIDDDSRFDQKFSNEFGLQRMNPILVPDPRNLVFDCGKLSYLDKLLPQLKAEGHRVLIYNQMTRMIDIMEDYLNYRRYSYLRLDGSSKISDRRDMVNDWQNNDDIFVFLLSTRAGGLGINLTAADTVIFYDSDWNPTVDQQAMDRAHRLGQTRQVTVYRLITRGSIEERILQRAKQKDEIQKVVIAGGEFRQIPNAGNSAARSKEIMSLLLDDQDLESELFLFGHVRDFFGKLFKHKEYAHLRVNNGYAPLNSDFESFYTRRMYYRIRDNWNRPITGVPGRTLNLLVRESKDYNMTFNFTGQVREVLNLGSYNYLGFAQSEGLCAEETVDTIRKYGVSVCGPRAESGTLDLHRTLEREVARFVGKEDAIVISMGFATNSTNIPSLVEKGSLIISDELNHSSIVFGARLSNATIRTFKHNNAASLEKVLRTSICQGQPRTHRPWNKILVVVEGLYSMEGTICALPEIVALKRKYKFYLYLDEAHSIGALGPRGRGVCDLLDVDPADVDLMMGTFTKSFGAAGGYIAGDKNVIAHLRNNSHGSVYAEAVSPPVVQQIITSMRIIAGEDGTTDGIRRIRAIHDNSVYFRRRLIEMGFIVYGDEGSPIIPLLLFHPGKIGHFSRECLKRGVAVVVVGYPATPIITSRARFCISAAHTRADLDSALEKISEVGDIMLLKHAIHKQKKLQTNLKQSKPKTQ